MKAPSKKPPRAGGTAVVEATRKAPARTLNQGRLPVGKGHDAAGFSDVFAPGAAAVDGVAGTFLAAIFLAGADFAGAAVATDLSEALVAAPSALPEALAVLPVSLAGLPDEARDADALFAPDEPLSEAEPAFVAGALAVLVTAGDLPPAVPAVLLPEEPDAPDLPAAGLADADFDDRVAVDLETADEVDLEAADLDAVALDVAGLDAVGLDAVGLDAVDFEDVEEADLDDADLDDVDFDGAALDAEDFDAADLTPAAFLAGEAAEEAFDALLVAVLDDGFDAVGLDAADFDATDFLAVEAVEDDFDALLAVVLDDGAFLATAFLAGACFPVAEVAAVFLAGSDLLVPAVFATAFLTAFLAVAMVLLLRFRGPRTFKPGLTPCGEKPSHSSAHTSYPVCANEFGTAI